MPDQQDFTDPCPKCGGKVPLSNRECPVCSTSLSFPNVRMAERELEANALHVRFEAAGASADAMGTIKEVQAFEAAVLTSKAVMNRSFGALHNWVTGFSELFITYHRQVQAGVRFPSGSEWDEQRSAAEAAINPYCFADLSYAALSLDRRGMTYYGAYCVVLKNITIEDRSSVFEENPFYFNRRHVVIAGSPPPFGHRATWAARGKLATAKLHLKVTAGMTHDAFPNILMEDRRDQPDCDFVEVHIYGPINRAGMEQVTGPIPERTADKILWRHAIRALKKLDVQVEETP